MLDKSLKKGDSKYEKALSAMAAKIAYENAAFIKTTITNHWEVIFLSEVLEDAIYIHTCLQICFYILFYIYCCETLTLIWCINADGIN